MFYDETPKTSSRSEKLEIAVPRPFSSTYHYKLAAMEDLGKIDYDIICIFENRPLLDVLRRNPKN